MWTRGAESGRGKTSEGGMSYEGDMSDGNEIMCQCFRTY